ncbi:MAG: hypothetical protein MUF30_00915 [Burkholderiales bacterium]|nr:hypothetical protein [Burkholderiales bacterium]
MQRRAARAGEHDRIGATHRQIAMEGPLHHVAARRRGERRPVEAGHVDELRDQDRDRARAGRDDLLDQRLRTDRAGIGVEDVATGAVAGRLRDGDPRGRGAEDDDGDRVRDAATSGTSGSHAEPPEVGRA